MKKVLLSLLLAVIPLSLLAASGTAIPGGVQSTPFIINKPGAYYLAGNRTMTDKNTPGAIQILADNVTLDLNGFTLSYSDSVFEPTPFGHGIFSNKSNVEVRNGAISTVPSEAVHAQIGDGFRLIDVRILDSRGVRIDTPGALVERCHITESRGWGIEIGGFGSIVKDCTVNWVEATGPSNGHAITVGTGCGVINCRVANTDAEGIEIGGNGALVDGCTLANTNLSKISYCAAITVAGTGNQVRRNTITQASGAGIRVFDYGYGSVVEQNVISTTASAGPTTGVGIISLNASTILVGNKGASNAGGFIAGQYVNGGGNLGN